MQHLHVWFVAAAYAITAGILLADALLPRFKLQSLLRDIVLRERRRANPKPPASSERPIA
jgi:hypothetical protein